MPDQPTHPTLAEYARTALAQASVGSVATKGDNASPGFSTDVMVEDKPDARPVIHLDESSPDLQALSVARAATLSVAGAEPFRSLDLIGMLLPCRSDRPGQRSFRISPLTVRLVGSTTRVLHPDEFHSAQPDPLADLAPAFLHHLRYAHTADLLLWVEEQGFDQVDTVVPRRIDRYGIELAVLSDSGVHGVRLTFPQGPIGSIDHVPLRLSSSSRCRDHGQEGR